MAKKNETHSPTGAGTPKQRTCGAMQQHFHLLETDPNFSKNQVALEHACQARLRSAAVARVAPYKITVVVHVVHNPASPAEKISVAQVNSQIAVLNRDYRATNPDKSKTPAVFSGLVADPMIEFALATKDPAGHATTGITFTETTQTSFSDRGNPVKFKAKGGVNAWNTKKYLNIWVCTLCGQLAGLRSVSRRPGQDRWRRDSQHRLWHHRQCCRSLQPGPLRYPRNRSFPQPAPHLGRYPRLLR